MVAKQKYNSLFDDLTPELKQKVHNTALENLGVRMKFTFSCMKCGKVFEDYVEGNLVSEYIDIQSETNCTILQTVCPECIAKQELEDKAREEEDLWKSENAI
jgi:phage terminase large subunit GpA-like protein